ncbi:hypothetical protein [Microbacterium sp.]
MSDEELDPTAQAVKQVMSLSDEDFSRLMVQLDSSLPTSQRELEKVVSSALPEGFDAEQMTAFALALAGNLYWESSNPDSTLRRVGRVTSRLIDAEASEIEHRLRMLFRSRAVLLVSGAQSGKRKTSGLVERVSVNMDLRPVVHPDTGKAELFTVYHRLHLVVTDDEAGLVEKTIEVVLDHADLARLESLAAASLQAQREMQTALGAAGSAVYLPLREEE